MITGLFETHINVTNLERSLAFYRDVLGLEVGRVEEERRVAFLWMGRRWRGDAGTVGEAGRAGAAAAFCLSLDGRGRACSAPSLGSPSGISSATTF